MICLGDKKNLKKKTKLPEEAASFVNLCIDEPALSGAAQETFLCHAAKLMSCRNKAAER